MYYDFKIVTPEKTLESDKLVTRMKMALGEIIQVSILFPSGCIGLVHVQIFRGGHQLYPANVGDDFSTNNEVINFVESYKIKTQPAELIALTWNTDTVYSHITRLRFNLMPFKVVEVPESKETLLDKALRGLGLR